MANSLTFKINIDDGGTMTLIASESKKAAAGLKKIDEASKGATESSNRYSKQQKGVAGSTSNSTKAFSKMTTGIEGGLVPAYATLAAHVFAVTAAFGVLSRAASIKQLNEGLLFTGRAAGENLTIVTKHLRDITDNAISSADAMRALAVGVSAGFSENQMEGLTGVAKGASLALGRDMTDALDRLVRGAAKLEPEILDELGIMVRLDDATEKYAASLGRAVGDLSQFERRMAFTNAVIEQGQMKFGALSLTIESNPFNKLGATFLDLTNSLMTFLNMAAGPIAGFLAGSMTALISSIAVLGTGVLTMMVPALTQGGRAAAQMAQDMAEGAKSAIAQTKSFKGAPKAFDALSEAIQNGTASEKDMKAATTSLNKSIKLHTSQLPEFTKLHKEGSIAVIEKTAKLNAAKAALLSITTAQELEAAATLQSSRANTLAAASAGQYSLTITLLKGTIELETAATARSTIGKGFLARAYANVSLWASVASLSVKAFGLALIQAIPIIGQVVLAGTLLYEGLKWLFGKDAEETISPLTKVLEEGRERAEEYPAIINQMTNSYDLASTGMERYIIVLTTMNGLLGQTKTQVDNLRRAEEIAGKTKEVTISRKLREARAALKDAQDQAEIDGEAIRSFNQKYGGSSTFMGGGPGSRINKEGVTPLEKKALEIAKEIPKLEAQLKSIMNAAPSDERVAGVSIAFSDLADSLHTASLGLEANSQELALNKRLQKEVSDILENLTADNLVDAEKSFSRITAKIASTAQSFKTLKEVGAELDAMFAKNKVTSGEFGASIDIIGKALDSLKGTGDPGGKQTEALLAAMSKYNVQSEKALRTLETRFIVAQQILDIEAFSAELLSQRVSSLNQAGLKEKALAVEKYDLEFRSEALQEKMRLKALQGLSIEKELLEILKNKAEIEKNRRATIDERQATNVRLTGDTSGAGATGAFFEKNATEFGSALVSDKLKMIGEGLNPMFEKLKALGPDGELVAAIGQGSLVLGEAFSAAFERAGDGAMSLKDKIGLAGAVVNQLANVMAAASKSNIAGIESQIKAEQARDGKSAESVAKLKALEAKKTAAQKKAFELNKKMMIASTIISTTSAAMAANAPPPLGLGPVFGPILAGAMVALGAAQVAIIAGTSFQGGGGGGSNIGASTVSVGNRQNSVDLAKARSPSGELGYARGAQGTGSGMTNFTPTGAFAGTRYRASGGNTSFMVGEQGPELFTPEMPGRISPADESSMGGAPVNVTFTINAIDSRGIEDVLNSQRGNLVGIIREAANAHGESFLENVNVESYQGSAGGPDPFSKYPRGAVRNQ